MPRRAGFFGELRASIAVLWRAAPGWMGAGLALLALQSAFPPLFLLALRRAIDLIEHARPSSSGVVTRAIALAAGLAIGEALIRALATFAGEAQTLAVTDTFVQKIAEKTATLDLATLEDPATADLRHRATEEGPYRAMMLSQTINQVTRAGLTLIGLSILILSYRAPALGLLLLAILPLITLRAWRNRGLFERRARGAELERRADYLVELLTRLDSAKEMRLLNAAPLLGGRLRGLRYEARQERLAIARARIGSETLVQTGIELAIFGGLMLLANRAASGGISIGGMVVGFWALQYGRSLIGELAGGLGGLHEHVLHLSSLRAFLKTRAQLTEPARPAEIPLPLRDGLRLDGVSFTYPGNTRPSLDAIDLVIRPGERIALVGENGSGKTSLIKLLCRLHDPGAGTVTLEGNPLPDYALADVRAQFSVLFQDFMRYELNVIENIRFGADADTVAAALTRAGADGFVGVLPRGIYSQLGRRFAGGTDLSLGQWQRLALARTLYSDAPIIILDEPTSALDARAEQEIFDRLWVHAEGRTLIVVSHRLSTVRRADRIIVLEAGQIAESGDHDTLIALGGLYARLFALQAGPYR